MPPVPTATPEPLRASSPAPRGWRYWAPRWVPVVFVVLGCVYVGQSVNLHDLGASLLKVKIWPLAAAVIFSALGAIAHAAYWSVLLTPVAPLSLRTMSVYTFASYAANAFLPMRAGEALRVWLVNRRHGVPVAFAGAVIAIEKLFDVTSLLLLVTPLPWLIPDLPPSVANALRILPCIVLAAAVAILVASRHALRWKFLSGFAVVRRPGIVAGGFACILLAWLFDVCAILAVLFAVHLTPSLDKALVVILSVNAAVAIPATPGQVGAHELGSTFALHLVGVPETLAIPFALFYHATQLIPILLIGLSTARVLAKEKETAPPPP